MARLASAADFEGGPLYSNYQRYPFFAWRAEWLVARWGTTGKWLIVGCGWGFLVDELLKLGVDAWGIDASAYAKVKATAVLPAASAARILTADGTNRTQMATAKTAAGLASSAKWTRLVTEDVLPALTAAEVTAMLTECRRVCTSLLHICSSLKVGEDPAATGRLTSLNWKTAAAWKALVSPDALLNDDGFAKYGDVIAAEVL